jgi:hypothetical protein
MLLKRELPVGSRFVIVAFNFRVETKSQNLPKSPEK